VWSTKGSIVIAKPDSAGAKAFRARGRVPPARGTGFGGCREPKRGTMKQPHPAGSLNSDGQQQQGTRERLSAGLASGYADFRR
jgi:hypothetical protein